MNAVAYLPCLVDRGNVEIGVGELALASVFCTHCFPSITDIIFFTWHLKYFFAKKPWSESLLH